MTTINPIGVLNQTPVMTPIAKPTIKNTKFKPVPKPIATINLFPPSPPKPVEVETVKPENALKPRTLKMEDYLPLVALGVIGLFVMSRSN